MAPSPAAEPTIFWGPFQQGQGRGKVSTGFLRLEPDGWLVRISHLNMEKAERAPDVGAEIGLPPTHPETRALPGGEACGELTRAF